MMIALGQRFLSKLASQVMLFEGDRQHRVRVTSLASSAQALSAPLEKSLDEGVATVLKTRLRNVRTDLTDFTCNSSTRFRNEFREILSHVEKQIHTVASSLMANSSAACWDHVRALANAITSTPSGCLFSMPGVSDQVRSSVMDVATQGFDGLLLDADVSVYNERACFRRQFLEVLTEVAGKVETGACMARLDPCQRLTEILLMVSDATTTSKETGKDAPLDAQVDDPSSRGEAAAEPSTDDARVLGEGTRASFELMLFGDCRASAAGALESCMQLLEMIIGGLRLATQASLQSPALFRIVAGLAARNYEWCVDDVSEYQVMARDTRDETQSLFVLLQTYAAAPGFPEACRGPIVATCNEDCFEVSLKDVGGLLSACELASVAVTCNAAASEIVGNKFAFVATSAETITTAMTALQSWEQALDASRPECEKSGLGSSALELFGQAKLKEANAHIVKRLRTALDAQVKQCWSLCPPGSIPEVEVALQGEQTDPEALLMITQNKTSKAIIKFWSRIAPLYSKWSAWGLDISDWMGTDEVRSTLLSNYVVSACFRKLSAGESREQAVQAVLDAKADLSATLPTKLALLATQMGAKVVPPSGARDGWRNDAASFSAALSKTTV